MQQRAEAEEKKRLDAEERADDAWAVEWYVFFSVFALYALTTAPSVAGGDRANYSQNPVRSAPRTPRIPPVHPVVSHSVNVHAGVPQSGHVGEPIYGHARCCSISSRMRDHEGIVTVRRPVRPLDHWRISGLPLRF